MPAQPEDHRSLKPQKFRFTDFDGDQHTLPLASTARSRLSGGEFMDAVLGGDAGQLTYLFKLLQAANPKPDAMAALRAMPQDQMLDVLVEWGEYGDGDGASLGESPGSST